MENENKELLEKEEVVEEVKDEQPLEGEIAELGLEPTLLRLHRGP